MLFNFVDVKDYMEFLIMAEIIWNVKVKSCKLILNSILISNHRLIIIIIVLFTFTEMCK